MVEEYRYYINTKLINVDYSALTEEMETKVAKFKVMIEGELLSIKIILVKVTLQIGEKKYLSLVLF